MGDHPPGSYGQTDGDEKKLWRPLHQTALIRLRISGCNSPKTAPPTTPPNRYAASTLDNVVLCDSKDTRPRKRYSTIEYREYAQVKKKAYRYSSRDLREQFHLVYSDRHFQMPYMVDADALVTIRIYWRLSRGLVHML
jgi:hypothetical protein